MNPRAIPFPYLRTSCRECVLCGSDGHLEHYKNSQPRWGCNHDADTCPSELTGSFIKYVDHI